MYYYYDFTVVYKYAPSINRHKYICARTYEEALKRLNEYRDWISKDGVSYFDIVSYKIIDEENLNNFLYYEQ